MDEEALRVKLEASVGLSNDVLSNEKEALARLLLRLEGLEKQCVDESAWMMRLSTGISSQKKLPNEVLALIFKLCANYGHQKLDVPPHPQSPCMVLSQVCSRWRQVALGEPSLWNMISVKVPRKVRPDVLETILSRAGNNITFHSTMEYILPPLLRVIHQYSNHYRALELQVNPSQAVEHLNVPFGGLTQLRHLLLKVKTGLFRPPGRVPLNSVLSSFKNAPELRELQIQGSTSRYTLPLDLELSQTSPFFWSGLQHVDIRCSVSTVEFLYILVGCGQLVTCAVNLDHTDNYDAFLVEQQLDKLLMPNLYSLRLSAAGKDISWLLYNLFAPSLNELYINSFHTTPHTFLHFIRGTECNIRVLSVAPVPGPSSDLRDLMQVIPKAIKLFLEGCTVNSHVLHSLSTRELLPALNVLGLAGHFDSLQAVRELISKRCDTGLQASGGVINGFYIRLSKADSTVEWEKFAASLPDNGVVHFGISHR